MVTLEQIIAIIDDNPIGLVFPDIQSAFEEPKEVRIVVADDLEEDVEFTTENDSRVCPICEDLDRDVYQIDDDLKPVIPDDTHPNCRCYYVYEGTNEEVPESEL